MVVKKDAVYVYPSYIEFKTQQFREKDIVNITFVHYEHQYKICGRIKAILTHGMIVDYSEHFLAQEQFVAYETITDISEFEDPV